MTFNVRAVATAGGASSVTATWPTTVTGDMLLAWIDAPGGILGGVPSGWTALISSGSQAVWQKSADGTEGGTTLAITATLGAAEMALVVMENWPPMWGSATFFGDTGTAVSVSTHPGDILLAFGAMHVGGRTMTLSSTTSGVTFTNDAQRTTDSSASMVSGHAYPNSATTNVTYTRSPSGGSAFMMIVPFGAMQTFAQAGGAASVGLPAPINLTAAAGGAATVTIIRLSAAAGGQAAVSVNLGVSGVAATVSGAAPTAGVTVGTSLPSIQAVTALAQVNVDPPTATFDGGDIDVTAETASSSIVANPGLVSIGGARPLGDDFANPYQVNGSGGVVTVTTGTFTVEGDEPAPVWAPSATTGDLATTLSNTAWIRYVGTQTGTLTVTGETGIFGPYQIELFEGATLDSLTRIDGQNNFQINPDTGQEISATLTDVVSANIPMYVRLWPTDPGDTDLVVHVTFTFTPDANPGGSLSLNITTPNFSAPPGVIRADVIGGSPGGDLVFDLLGTTASFANPPGIGLGAGVATYAADTSGNLYSASIPLPMVSAGTYTLQVTDSSTGLSTSGTVQVEADPIAPPGTLGADDPIGAIAHGSTVRYWVFRDPAPSGLGTYVFTVNPTTMTSPHPQRNVTIEHLVSPGADQLIWEGAYKANEWHFQGSVLAQADYDSIVSFAELNRRFWIVDHRDRAWVCSIESIAWTKHHDISNNWAWDYDITALIYDGPIPT